MRFIIKAWLAIFMEKVTTAVKMIANVFDAKNASHALMITPSVCGGE